MFRRTWGYGFVLASMLACSGCEPNRMPRASADSQRPTGDSQGTAVEPKRLPGRCIKATPAEASRQSVGVAENCPADPGPVPELARAVVEFEGAKASVSVELAKEPEHRQRGLMYRTAMAENDGMLFQFDEESTLTFWMRNTCLPLDMLFIASDGTIVGIEENTPTLTDQEFSVGCKSRYVLEVNAGWARKNGIRAGMRARLP